MYLLDLLILPYFRNYMHLDSGNNDSSLNV